MTNSSSQSNGSDALARYQYLLRTASPDQLEQAHQQAFAAMTPAERQEVLQALSTAGAQTTDASAASLARSATRLEVQQPGTLQKVLGNVTGGTGRSLLTSLAIGMAGAGIYDLLFQNDGPGRPSVMSRLLGGGLLGGLFGRRGYGGGNQWGGGMQPPPPQGGGMFNGLFGGRNGGPGDSFGGGFGGGGFGGPGGGPDGGGFGGPGGGPGGGGTGGPGGGGPGGGGPGGGF